MASRALSLGSGPVDVLARFLTVPLVTITTAGAAPIVSKETYLAGTLTISRTRTPYNGAIQIRGRGNSSWDAPKKPYRVKLGAAAALLGMPSEKDWVLLANFYDESHTRTALALEMGRRASGLPWTPQMRYAEVVLNGDHLGLYQLGQHVEISPAKINITAASGTGGLSLTGGYSLEIDQRGVVDWGEPGFVTAHDGISVSFDDPDGSNPAQAAYLENWFNDFETTLYGPDWLDPDTGYARLIDRNSFIDWYLVEELCRNVDSDFYSSCKLFKERDTTTAPGRLHLGPLWDFDLSLGIEWIGEWPTPTAPAEGSYTLAGDPAHDGKGATWIVRMRQDPAFAAALRQRWQVFCARLTAGVDSIADFLARQALITGPPVDRDKARWGHTRDRYADVAAIMPWLTTRIAWLDGELAP